MARVIAFILIFFWVKAVWAWPVRVSMERECSLVEKASFDPTGPIHSMSASPMFQHGRNRCSSFVLSKEGYVMTNSHCLSNCGKSCEISVNDRSLKAEVIARSSCTADEVWRAKSHEECPGVSDFVIVKVDAAVTRELGCLKISEEPVSVGDELAAIGFPGKTDRRSENKAARDANGVSQMVSYGRVVRRDTCDPVLTEGQDDEDALRAARERASWFVSPSEIARARFYQTEIDLVHGSSGGPVLNSRGEVIGLASRGEAPHMASFECRGATFVSSLRGLRATLEGRGVDAEKVLGCR